MSDLDILMRVSESFGEEGFDPAVYVGCDPDDMGAFVLGYVEGFQQQLVQPLITEEQLIALFTAGVCIGAGYHRYKHPKGGGDD